MYSGEICQSILHTSYSSRVCIMLFQRYFSLNAKIPVISMYQHLEKIFVDDSSRGV